MSAPVDLEALEALIAALKLSGPLELDGWEVIGPQEFPDGLYDVEFASVNSRDFGECIVAAVNALPALVRDLSEARATIATLDADNRRMAEALRDYERKGKAL